ncbi:MAG: tRNA threonylcarbamoyladenosine dehydratase [Myxococcota bacterium]
MNEAFERTRRFVGTHGFQRLREATVIVFGLGGVGSFCVEALARSGIGRLRIVDHDVVSLSNCNRQLHAMRSTLDRPKAEVMRARVVDIEPAVQVEGRVAFFARDTADALLEGSPSYVVDAIDALGPKVELLVQCRDRGIPVISAMGAAARLDPTRIRICALSDTAGDPLAARVRKMLRRRGGLDGVLAVCSTEPARPALQGNWQRMTDDLIRGRQRVIQPSMMMVPAAMGITAASAVIRHLLGESVC